MKRWAILGIAVVVVIILAGLSQTAISPRDFSGQWYSWEDQNLYVFQDGLIYCTKHPIPISGTESISGAYTYCRNSVVLFAAGIPGLEQEKELYQPFFYKIFAPCGIAAANVTLGTICVHNFLHLSVEKRVYFFKPLRNVLVHRGLAYVKNPCRRSDGCSRFDYVLAKLYCAFCAATNHTINS